MAALPYSRPELREAALTRLREGATEREWEQRGHGAFAVLQRYDSRFVGRVGLTYRPQFDETELGWILRTDAQGHGFATEAAAEVLRWGLRALDVPYITAMIRPDNAPSIRVARRLQMAVLRHDVFMGEDVIVYHCLAENPRS